MNSGKRPGQRTYKKTPRFIPDPVSGELIRLTDTERRVINSIPSHDTFKKVASKTHTDTSTVSRVFNMPAVQAYFADLFHKSGVTDTVLVQRMKERLDAVTVKEFCTKDGIIVCGAERIDHEQRGRAVDQILRLQGKDKPPAENDTKPSVNINIAALSVEDLKTLVVALTPKAPARPAPAMDIADAELVEAGESEEDGEEDGE